MKSQGQTKLVPRKKEINHNKFIYFKQLGVCLKSKLIRQLKKNTDKFTENDIQAGDEYS